MLASTILPRKNIHMFGKLYLWCSLHPYPAYNPFHMQITTALSLMKCGLLIISNVSLKSRQQRSQRLLSTFMTQIQYFQRITLKQFIRGIVWMSRITMCPSLKVSYKRSNKFSKFSLRV